MVRQNVAAKTFAASEVGGLIRVQALQVLALICLMPDYA